MALEFKQPSGNIPNKKESFAAGVLGGVQSLPEAYNKIILGKAQHELEMQKIDLEKQKIAKELAALNDKQNQEKADAEQRANDKANAFQYKLVADASGNQKARSALSLNQIKLNAIGNAEALIEQTRNQPGGADKRQMFEVAAATARTLLGNNQLTEGEINQLIPSTYKGNINKFLEKVSNDPTGVDAQSFVNRYSDTIQREKRVAINQINSARSQLLGGNQNWLDANPDRAPYVYKALGVFDPRYNPDHTLLEPQGAISSPDASTTPASSPTSPTPTPPGFLDRMVNTAKNFLGTADTTPAANASTIPPINTSVPPAALPVTGQPAPKPSGLPPLDQEAMQWLNANPTDPRAVKIKALHGL
jgi:hypothetical protein